jgi:hypothetical protein
MPRKRDDEKLVGAYAPSPFAGFVERVAATRGVSKSALIRQALVDYVLPRSDK